MRERAKKCPLIGVRAKECIQGECAWWDEEEGECAILSIAKKKKKKP